MEAIKAPSMSCWMARAKIVVKSSRCVLLPRHADADDGGVKQLHSLRPVLNICRKAQQQVRVKLALLEQVLMA